MSKRSKQRGTSYEVRITNWFKELPGWDALRIPLSGASSSITQHIGGHDVKAWNEKKSITLIVEAKKRGTVKDDKRCNEMEIKKEWIDKIDFDKDEVLVFATQRSPHYALIPLKRFFQILGRKFLVDYNKEQIFKGKGQFLFKRESFEKHGDYYHINWAEAPYVIMLLEKFVVLRETSNLVTHLPLEDQIRNIQTLEQGKIFEQTNLEDLNYREKKMLYEKLDFLENGGFLNPLFHAKEQWYNQSAFVCICPHCEQKILKSDFESKTFVKDIFES